MTKDVPARAGEQVESAMTGRDGIVHAHTRALLSYWEGLRRGQLVPFRSHVDPRHMRCDIGNLFILEALPDGAQRFRVAGSRIVDMFGMELRGLSVRAIMAGEGREELGALVAETLDGPSIAYARLRPDIGDPGLWEMLMLPLRSDDGSIDRIIGYIFQLAGGRGIDGLLPLKLVFERRALERIEEPPVQEEEGRPTGLAEEQAGFAGPAAPDGPARLTAIDGDATARSGPRRPPALRIVGEE